MEAIEEQCCGLDVHQATVVACLLVGPATRRARKEVRTYGTTTRDLMQLRDWLHSEGVTCVGMESSGVYWKPVYNILEDDFDLIVGNAHHIKNVPGRKTDVKDAEWVAQLIRHGLVSRSFVPPRHQRDLRDLVRYRRKLVHSRTDERNRLQKLLETANIKLASVASDVFGVSGMAMLRALVDGESSPAEISLLAKGRLRRKIEQLEPALEGRLEEHHRYLLRMQLARLEQVDAHIAQLDERIASQLKPYGWACDLVKQIPGVDRVLSAVIIAELGVDMSVFKSFSHLASWAGVCPGNNESGGKRRRGKTRKGNVHLRTALVEAAQSASKTKGTYLRDKFYRLKARRGYKRALMAIAHKILRAVYEMLLARVNYKELGETYLDQRDEKRVVRQHVRRLECLGYQVTLQPNAA
jgi:transposase